MSKEVSDIKTSLEALQMTEDSPKDESGVKLAFKMQDDTTSDHGSTEGLETIDYFKIESSTNVLKDDQHLIGDQYGSI